MFKKKPILLDCDPGHDDVLAILLAANHPELDLLGITTVGGNATVDKTTKNALEFCTLADIVNMPIAAGMSRGLVRSDRVNTESEIHRKSGLDGYRLHKPKINKIKKHGVNFIIDTIQNSLCPVTIIPTGPLSNIAMALLLEPKIKENIKEIILMGGAINLGNRTPAAEFNIWADPEKAKVIFQSGIPIVMVGLEATHKAELREQDLAKFGKYQHPVGKAIKKLMEFALVRYQKTYRTKGLPIHDVCAVAVAINKQIVSLEKMYVDIEIGGEFCSGRTVCDVNNRYGKEKNAEVVMDLDGEKVIEMIYNVLENYG